jgi:programmed cell death protein 5
MTSAADDSMELEAFRQRRQLELQKQLEQHAKQQAAEEVESQVQAQEQQALDQAMKTILTSEARGRLTNISLVDSSKADLLKRQLVSLHDQQKISIPVNDDQLKRILASLSKSRRDASIRRI